MEKIRLGRTDLFVGRVGFGALPIQRISHHEAALLLKKAYFNGINFFDTARGYTDSEEKIGNALSGVRKEIYIATKSNPADKKEFFQNLETSLAKLKTDYIDIYQLHNPNVLPDPENPDSLYGAMQEAKKKGMIRFIGISNHRLNTALEAVRSGLYDTVQFPLCTISSDKDLSLIEECSRMDVGVIAMKALSGGLLTDAASAFTFLRQYDNLVPIWGIQRESELDEFLSLEKNPPEFDDKMKKIIKKDRTELSGSFCRACGYCMPCPEGIPINMAARMPIILDRMPYRQFMEDSWKQQMELIKKCKDCGHCKKHCPYDLDTPALLKKSLEYYSEFYENNRNQS